MSPEERAEARLAENRVREEVLAVKRAFSAELNAMTTEERLAYYKKIGAECRALGYNVVSRRSSLSLSGFSPFDKEFCDKSQNSTAQSP
jgi:hypothetical protein